ncbi:MAG: tetratricopeptide repeat protein [Candidatus Riflebacteria bacterium]|nr:tetratricopeptide repeat protein [Candidatus Riflebacteria bacterium]
MKKSQFFIMIFALTALCAVEGRELVPPLREAQRLYEQRHYEEAASRAYEYYKYYPDDVQAMIICGMSEFHAGNYFESIDMFVLANRKQPKHPIIERYLGLLRELEYRSEPFTSDIEIKSKADPKKTAEFYKRQFFGPSFNIVSGKGGNTNFISSLEPHLMKTPSEARNVRLVTALPVSAPAKSLLGRNTMESMAEKALSEGQYLKSYLFYSQLLASSPQSKFFLLGKAESAFHMKRYEQVLEMLGNISITDEIKVYDESQRQKIDNMLAYSRLRVFNSNN